MIDFQSCCKHDLRAVGIRTLHDNPAMDWQMLIGAGAIVLGLVVAGVALCGWMWLAVWTPIWAICFVFGLVSGSSRYE